MDRDTFIITVYCLVVKYYRALAAIYPLRRGGFAPALTDEEVITMEICGEYFKHSTDKDLFAYFRDHYHHFFPALGARALFVRQAADLWQIKARIQQQIVKESGAASDPVQVIDTLPLPVCQWVRGIRDRCFTGVADYGFCAAKQLHYYGFKLGLRVSRCGMIIHSPLLCARAHDVNHLDTLVEDFVGVVPADKGFIDEYRQTLLRERHHIQVVAPPRARMTSDQQPAVLKACARIRKVVETVGSQLTGRFGVEKIRVHDLWHFQHRLIRKILAHTVVVFLNLKFGRDPLDLDGLVPA